MLNFLSNLLTVLGRVNETKSDGAIAAVQTARTERTAIRVDGRTERSRERSKRKLAKIAARA